MLIGDRVIYEGQAYVVVGFTPISVAPAEVQLRPPDGGEGFWIERGLISQPARTSGAAFAQAPPRALGNPSMETGLIPGF
jgi:hypothetical protein